MLTVERSRDLQFKFVFPTHDQVLCQTHDTYQTLGLFQPFANRTYPFLLDICTLVVQKTNKGNVQYEKES